MRAALFSFFLFRLTLVLKFENLTIIDLQKHTVLSQHKYERLLSFSVAPLPTYG